MPRKITLEGSDSSRYSRRSIGIVALSVAVIGVTTARVSGLFGGETGSPPVPSATTITLPRCPPTTLTRDGPQSRALYRDNLGGTWDLRGGSWRGAGYPIRADAWTRGCVVGGEVQGSVPPAATRDEWYDGVGGPRVGGEGLRVTMTDSAKSWLVVKDMVIRDVEDAYDPNAGGTQARTYLDHVRAEYVRDDCLENEQPVHNVYVKDSLLDGCFTAFAERPSGSESGRDGTTPVDFVVESSLVHVEPQPLGRHYCNDDSVSRGRCRPEGSRWVGAYGIWKWSDQAAARVVVRNTIFRLDMPSYSSCRAQEWPKGIYENVTLVWTGPGPYRTAGGCRNTLPRGVTLTGDESVWGRAATAWLHQYRPGGRSRRRPAQRAAGTAASRRWSSSR